MPILVLLTKLAEETKNELVFVVINNLLTVLFLFFVVVFPLIIELKLWQRLVWIVSHYISLCVILFIVVFQIIANKKDFESLLKRNLDTPSEEYLNFINNNYDFEILFNDSYYLVVIKSEKNKTPYVVTTQFVSDKFLDAFLDTEENQIGRRLLKSDSLKSVIDKTYKSKHIKDSLIKYPVSQEITLNKLNLYKDSLNRKFYQLLNNCKIARDSAKYTSNKRYFEALTNYLISYENSYKNSKEISRIVNTDNIYATVHFDSTNYVSIIEIDENYYSSTKSNLLKIEKKLNDRMDKEIFMFSFLFYPVGLLLEKFDYFPENYSGETVIK